ncbi:cupin domain-containing protein [Pseudogulbenkiania sp. MAI-1]|uniref:cupin domain-containing protein n=1 Tax=Pseudogulbenkiania sp. MAI-1 TaxID=990370 RepID=UPI000A054DE7|nr:cupin domain-containing protein [Pseudogulbenkiania sp. MAI-1]
MNGELKKPSATKIFMEGPEVVRLYFKTEKLTFGTSQLNPGQTGAVDPGHPDSHEVFFVVRGTVLLRVGDVYHEMHEGDAVLVPPAIPHQLTNIGLDIALVSFSLAPSEF